MGDEVADGVDLGSIWLYACINDITVCQQNVFHISFSNNIVLEYQTMSIEQRVSTILSDPNGRLILLNNHATAAPCSPLVPVPWSLAS